MMLAFGLFFYQCLGITMAYLEMRIAMTKLVFSYDWEVVGDVADFVGNCLSHILWTKPALSLRFHSCRS